MSILIRTDPSNPDENALLKAVAVLKEGGVVAYPTETFYGLGADANYEKAVERVYALKGREFNKPLPLIIGDRKIVRSLVEDVPDAARLLMDAFWPGGLTIVFKASPLIVPRLTGGTGKIGIRLSGNPIASKLSALLSRPLTATSANLSGEKECVSAREVLEFLGDRVDAVVDGGATPGGKGSTIIDVTTDPPTVLRAGVISPSLIRHRLEKSALRRTSTCL